ncbi:endonuclease/exonuclease/phosphatase family protein [Cochlodiniinecator piscidefendens]|uniref:endonuclease/exonuclease/phosphatase family protein n=1 Tax=Cochlodiniinecator piscidefendens TaxID=2715756 RepID=UPI00140B9A3D|nr:endonuclease/exonuclease/phosphatase family protein [Cochlodiniinecator piscidefendens]
MRIATYNVEWFNSLFDDDGVLLNDGGWSKRRDVTRAEQTAALGVVFEAINADAIMVIEAPDSSRIRDGKKAIEAFAAHFGLRTNTALIGFENDTQQEITLLYDPAKLTVLHDPIGGDTGPAPRFDTRYALDLNVDAKLDKVVFSKPPLEVALKTKGGNALRLIGVHIKSKAPHGARNEQDAIRISIENRRKQLAQCIWLRQRVVEHLKSGESLVVLGDFNDGPGLDEYEKLFGRSGVEIVLGEEGDNCLFDPHARQVLSKRLGAQPVTSRFFIHQEDRYLSALLDYIMVSGDLRSKAPKWRIWHPFDDRQCYQTPKLRDALLTASDHFPVTMDIDI